MPEPEKVNPWWLPEEADPPAETEPLERTTREYPARRAGDRRSASAPAPQRRERDEEG